MVGRRDRASPGRGDRRSAGVYIERSRVDVGGDLVGRDKVTIGSSDREFEALFARLGSAIEGAEGLTADEKREVAMVGDDLKAELTKPEPDPGTLARLKGLLAARGGQIAAAVGAIFRYPPVQEAVKALTQRLLGG